VVEFTRSALFTTAYGNLLTSFPSLDLQPRLPPNVTHIVDSFYRVNIEAAVPHVSSLAVAIHNLIKFCTVVLRVTSPDGAERFYVLVSEVASR